MGSSSYRIDAIAEPRRWLQVLRKQEGVRGEQFTVLQGDHSKARFVLLKAGHSILGGRYTLPSYFANQSIYDVFYIHEGAR